MAFPFLALEVLLDGASEFVNPRLAGAVSVGREALPEGARESGGFAHAE
jgi:hypothetical protein